MIPKEEFPIELHSIYDVIKFDHNLIRITFIESKTKTLILENPELEETEARELATSIANIYRRIPI
jgi:hypothetical protein